MSKPRRFAGLSRPALAPGLAVLMALLLLVLLPGPSRATDYYVGSPAEIAITLTYPYFQPGDTLVMRNGIWRDADILFRALGQPDRPITLRAETPGQVLLTGSSRLRIAGSNLVVNGLFFTNGYRTSGDVISFRYTSSSASDVAVNCCLTNCAIVNYNPPSATNDTKWVSLYGYNNQVVNCFFKGKNNSGSTLVVWVDALPDSPNYHRIARNYFGPRPPLGFNGGETVRVGTSDVGFNVSRTTVEENYFEQCSGDAEIISNKSCENVYRRNTFVECEGALCLRHGNRCIVEGNYFFGRLKSNTGGVRILGEDHLVYDNYFAELMGSSSRSALTLSLGLTNTPLNGYFQVQRATVAFNTFYNCYSTFLLGLSDTYTGTTNVSTLPPVDCTIANNLAQGGTRKLIDQRLEPVNLLWEGNIIYGASLGIATNTGLVWADPKLASSADGLWRPASDSPALRAAQGTYAFVTNDIEGQPRLGAKDVGCDQVSEAPVLWPPLRPILIGPRWIQVAALGLTWSNPADLVYGTALSARELNATANVAGTFEYTPPLGTVLNAASNQVLSVAFTPNDTNNYIAGTRTVTINVLKATPVISWPNPVSISYGTLLGTAQLNASADVPGAFLYAPPAGAKLNVGAGQVLSVTFTPQDQANYNRTNYSVPIDVLKATPVITWSNPADITNGTPLSSLQLNARANVPGAMLYNPRVGTILDTGNGQILSVVFTPQDAANYTVATQTVTLNVFSSGKITPTLLWSPPAAIAYGTPLSEVQLNALASVPGIFMYIPPLGAILNAGNGQILSVTFIPSDLVHYTLANKWVTINVQMARPVISWPEPASVVSGTELSDLQLNASANVPGQFVYDPPVGTILDTGDNQVLTVSFTPLDRANYVLATNSVLIDVLPPTQVMTGMVQVAYLIPANRLARSNVVLNLQKSLLFYQSWFRDQMKRNGFAGKTFALETEADGVTPKVRIVPLAETDDELRSDVWGGRIIEAAVQAGLPVGTPGQIWWLAPEAHNETPDGFMSGSFEFGFSDGGSGHAAGWAVVGSAAAVLYGPEFLTNNLAYDSQIVPALGPYPLRVNVTFPWFEGATLSSVSSSALGAGLHSLAVAFGLDQDFRNDENFHGNLMGDGFRGFRGNMYPVLYPFNYTRLSYGAALALNVSPYFNNGKPLTDEQKPTVSVLTSGNLDPENGVLRIDFSAADSGGLSAALLAWKQEYDWLLVDEIKLSGHEVTATFFIPYYDPGRTNEFLISIYDRQGNKESVSTVLLPSAAFNQAPWPQLKATPVTAGPGEDVILDATATFDPGHGVSMLEIEWDLDGDRTFDTEPTTTLMVTNHYPTVGNRLVRARITDPAGGQAISAPLPVSITLCPAELSPASRPHGYGAATGAVVVTTGFKCHWIAVSSNNWITVLSGTNSTGPGTVTYRIDANPGREERVGGILIADQFFVLTQRTAGCGYSLSPTNRFHGYGATSGSLKVNAQSDCAWTVLNTNDWISIIPPADGQGTGSVSYAISPNYSPDLRMGVLIIAEQTFILGQWGTNCACVPSPPSRAHGYGMETGVVNVSASSGCAWDVINTNDWIFLTSNTNGVGNSNFAYSVSANPGPTPRTGSLMIGGAVFSITQSGCAYELSPPDAFHGPDAETGSISVSTANECLWTATPSEDWIRIIGSTTGVGPGSFEYAVAPTTYYHNRAGFIEVSGAIYAITQLGLPCRYEISPANWTHSEEAEVGEVLVLTGDGCPWNIVNTNAWISLISGMDGAGPASVIYFVSANHGLDRSGNLLIAGWPYVVNQIGGLRLGQVGTVAVASGKTNWLPVSLAAHGNENALGFSLCYDPGLLTFVSARLGAGVSRATLRLTTNQLSAGQLGLSITMPAGWVFGALTQTMVEVAFRGGVVDGTVLAPLKVCDQPVAQFLRDINSQSLDLSLGDGAVQVIGDCTLGGALDARNLAWTWSGDATWICQTNMSWDGQDAAESGPIGDSQNSYLQTTVTGPVLLTFWWKVSSEAGKDRLRFSLNGSQQTEISGEVDWQQQTYTLGTGSQSLQWRYSKSSSTFMGLDRGWVDQIQVTPLPPVFTTQPISQSLDMGGSVTFTAAVSGSPPFAYQWQFNGANLVAGPNVRGVTNSTLILSNLTTAQAGYYSVLVSNAAETVSSSNALLMVSPLISLAEALDTPGWLWTTSGAPSWVGQTVVTHDGANAARSGMMGNSQTNSMQTLVNGPGAVSFWWKVSSETNNDRLMFYINNTEQARISGEVDWEWRVFDVPAGSNQVLQWSYYKSSSTVQGQDRAWVDQVRFGPAPPVITNQSISQVVDQGATVTLTVGVRGTPPFSYQWQLDGEDLTDGPGMSGTATATLRLTNAQPAQAGVYSVLLSNAVATVSSSNIFLTVNLVPSLAEALDTPGWAWTNTTASNWFGQLLVTHDGVDAARSGAIGNSQNSIMQTTLTGPGILSFWWKVSSESGSDYLRFYLNGSDQFRISGEVDWQWRTVNLSSGAQVVQWRYTKNSSSTAGQDRGWVDELIFVPTNVAAAPVIALQPVSRSLVALTNTSFLVGALGSAPLGYQWQWNGFDLTNGAGASGVTTSNLTLTSIQGWRAGLYSVRVSNAAGSVTSSNALLTVITAPLITNQPASQSVVAGTTVNFTVGAIGQAPMSYQWQCNGVNLVNGGNISGATSAALRLSSATGTQGGAYSVMVSNAAGKTTSATAVLTVITPPVISSQPLSQSVGMGATVLFTVGASSTVPLAYRWRWNGANLFDGGNISAANSPTLIISNVQPSQLGSYSVVISNAAAQVASANAVLTIVDPPAITNQPASQKVPAGATVLFIVKASGTTPLGYRWLLDGADLTNGGCIKGANTSTLTLSNVQPIHAGAFSVVVSNGAGIALSSSAQLEVVATMTLGQALNAAYLAWDTELNSPWMAQTNVSLDGVGAARSGLIGTNDFTWLQTAVLGPGTISFWWKVSSETNHDSVNFYLDDAEMASLSGIVEWQYRSFELSPGSHELRWTYEKDASLAQGQDCAWLDQVQFIPSTGPTVPVITSQPISQGVGPGAPVTFNVEATGSAPMTYQWRFNGLDLVDGANLSGATTPSLALTGVQLAQQGTYSVVVRNPYSWAMSTHALLSIILPIPLPEALDTPIRAWNVGGASLWLGQDSVTYDRLDAAQSGSIAHNQTNWIETLVDGPCAVSFWWKVSSETNHDRLRFSIDGVEKANISGAIDWRWRTFNITNNLTNVTHLVRWAYTKDVSGSAGLDRGWVDQVEVGPLGPIIDLQPMSLTAEIGAIAFFDIEDTGSDPMDYQWRLNLSPLVDGNGVIGATNRHLLLSNVQPAQAGTYSVLVSNPGGRTVSSNASLSLFSGTPLALALDTSGQPWNLGWISGGDAPWIAQTSTTHDGIDAAQSPGILDGQETWIETRVMGPGKLNFWWQVDSELNLDRLRIYVDGQNQTSISGLVPWQQMSFSVPGGLHAFRWRYMKNGTLSSGQDRAWVDQVQFVPIFPPVITNQPLSQIVDAGTTVTFTVGLSGSAPFVYQWQKNGVNLVNAGTISGVTNATLTIANAQLADQGLYSVVVTNPAAMAVSASALLIVIPTVPLPEALDAPALVWTTTGDALWIGQTNLTHDGVDAARSGILAEGAETWLQTTVNGPGAVTFWWKVSSEPSNDRLRFYINGSSQAYISGETDWQWVMFNVPNGPSTLGWRYYKNSNGVIGGQDRGWVDQVQFTTGPIPPMITNQPLSQTLGLGASASFTVTAGGSTPFSYQWRLNGQDLVDGPYISGATNARLNLPNLQLDQGGVYSVLVANDGGTVVSSDAGLTLITAPVITREPVGQTVAQGAAASLSVAANGAPPLQYQWYLNGVRLTDAGNVSGAQTANLTLTNLQSNQAGNYWVLVWNAEASALSAPVPLTVIQALPLGVALDLTNWVWTTSGDALWIGQAVTSHDGVDAAWSGNIGSNQQSSFQTTIDGPGTIRFWWRVSSEPSNDRLRFYIDGSEQARISGESGWLSQTSTVPAKSQVVLQWTYSKNGAIVGGEDHAWVDQVQFTPWAPAITNQPMAQTVDAGSTAILTVVVNGTPPLSYQWRFNGVNLTDGGSISGARTASLSIANVQATQAGNYSVVVSNAVGTVTSATAALSVTPLVPLADALDTPLLSYTTSGSPPWVGQPVVSHDGVDAARSGAIGNGTSTAFQTTVTGPASISFWWRVSCETNNDRLTFSVGGSEQARISGEVPWQQRTFSIPGGSQVLLWTYSKNSSAIAGQDRGWVDQVVFTSLAPLITNQPASQNVDSGMTVAFNVGAIGTPPLSYQWLLNDVSLTDGGNIRGARTNLLTITNVQPSQAGTYSVQVNNAVGSTVSSNALLVVTTLLPLVEAVDTPTWTYTLGGSANWVGQSVVTHDGVDAGRSGIITNSQTTYFQRPLTGPGAITFWWKVSSETNNDRLIFYTDSAERASISGETDWRQFTYDLASGSHTVQWTYSKNSSLSAGQDRAWVDQIWFGPRTPAITNQPASTNVEAGVNVTFTVGAGGTPPLTYQWLWKGASLPRATNTTLTLSSLQVSNSGTYSVLVSNAAGIVSSSNALLTVTPIYTLAEALDTPGWFWTNGGSAAWVGQGVVTHDGVDAARSAVISSSQYSSFQTVVNGPGTLSFWWKVSCYTNSNNLRFYLDGSEQVRISGEVNWEQRASSISSGPHLVHWRYNKSSSTIQGADRGWVDQIQLTAGAAPLQTPNPPALQIEVVGNSVFISWNTLPGRSCQLFYKNSLSETEWLEVPGEITATASGMTIEDTLTDEGQRFYRVLEY